MNNDQFPNTRSCPAPGRRMPGLGQTQALRESPPHDRFGPPKRTSPDHSVRSQRCKEPRAPWQRSGRTGFDIAKAIGPDQRHLPVLHHRNGEARNLPLVQRFRDEKFERRNEGRNGLAGRKKLGCNRKESSIEESSVSPAGCCAAGRLAPGEASPFGSEVRLTVCRKCLRTSEPRGSERSGTKRPASIGGGRPCGWPRQ